MERVSDSLSAAPMPHIGTRAYDVFVLGQSARPWKHVRGTVAPSKITGGRWESIVFETIVSLTKNNRVYRIVRVGNSKRTEQILRRKTENTLCYEITYGICVFIRDAYESKHRCSRCRTTRCSVTGQP